MRLAALLLLAAATAPCQVLRFAELSTTQIDHLDRAHTAVILTNGILEEHGPYLPSYSDGYWDEAMTASLATSIAARPGWTVVTLPVLPVGTSPANIIAKRYTFPGSVTVRATTMRALYMDLADALGEAGFRHLFIVDSHGGPANSVVLDQAGSYFADTYRGQMVHLLGLMPVLDAGKALEQMLTPEQLARNGMSVHADALEQSQVLFVAPQFVVPSYTSAPALGGSDVEALMRVAAAPGWAGYLGAPAYASAALGKRYFEQVSAAENQAANDILDGKLDPATMPRYGISMYDATASIETSLAAHEKAQAARQSAWLRKHPGPIEREKSGAR